MPGARANPTIDGDNVYLLSGVGRLGCFDAQSGKPRWSVEAPKFGGESGRWGYAESVLVIDDMVVFKPGGEQMHRGAEQANGRADLGEPAVFGRARVQLVPAGGLRGVAPIRYRHPGGDRGHQRPHRRALVDEQMFREKHRQLSHAGLRRRLCLLGQRLR
jgi:hypothetical protein